VSCSLPRDEAPGRLDGVASGGYLPAAMTEHAHVSAPTLPEPRDEAAPTPLWMPALGAVLVALLSLWVVFQLRAAEQAAAEAAKAEQAGAEAAEDASAAKPSAEAAPAGKQMIRAEPAPALRAKPAP